MIHHATLVGAGVLGGGTMALFQNIEDDVGASPVSQITFLSLGLSFWLFFDRREQKATHARNEERRTAAKEKDDRIAELEADVKRLTGELIAALKGPES